MASHSAEDKSLDATEDRALDATVDHGTEKVSSLFQQHFVCFCIVRVGHETYDHMIVLVPETRDHVIALVPETHDHYHMITSLAREL